jgi:hypothetical protein
MAQAAGTGARTNAGPAPAVSPRPAAPAVTNLALASSKPAAETPRPTTRVLPTSVSAPAPAPPKAENPIPKPPEVEIAQVQPDLIVKPPQDLTRTGTALGTNASSLAGRSEPGAAARGATNQTKRGLLARLNPFSGKPAQGEQTDAVPPVDGVRAGPGEASRPPVVADIDPARPVPRYNYLAPLAPTAGSNVEAEKEFKKAFRSAKAGNRPQAIAEYQAAVRIDPAYYDAYYNLGLAALENSDVRLSLWAYEIALALKPDAEDARYNFALALKSGGYWLDAVEELKRLLGANPDEARAHLSLANLYSQQLGQPHVARFHYERVLELNPRHPEAVRIRYWLAANQ